MARRKELKKMGTTGSLTGTSTGASVDRSRATPMMAQYFEIKAQHPDAVLLYRMGDFYEMFYEDAVLASKILGLTLTSRDKGQENSIPLAGLPWHSADPYIARLLKAGHKIAICEQVSDPPLKSGLMDRRVIEVLTPGTALQDGLLESRSNNFVLAIRIAGEMIGFAVADISTGEFYAGDLPFSEAGAQFERFRPSEMIVGSDQVQDEAIKDLFRESSQPYITKLDPWQFEEARAANRLREHFGLSTLAGWDLEDLGPGLGAAAALLDYARDQKQSDLPHIRSIRRLRPGSTMVLDAITLRHLEILEPLLGTDRATTLLSVLDRTCTPMGARKLRSALRAPLMDLEAIRRRHTAIGLLIDHPTQLTRLRQALGRIRDIERILGKVTTDRATPRDLAALRDSLASLPALQKECLELTGGQSGPSRSGEMPVIPGADIDLLADIRDLLERSLSECPPATPNDLGIIRDGYDQELDAIRQGSISGREWIAALQEIERKQTGIPTLKVGFNKVFGYYLEVTHAQLSKVPDHYIRKQTLVNAERFLTPELKEKEEKVLGAEAAEKKRQREILSDLQSRTGGEASRILETASRIAELDLLAGWAETAQRGGYIRPEMSETTGIRISQGRHSVVESFVGAGQFVANDVHLNNGDRQVQILTGPNMAGKSTFLRQVGILCIMAQAGSWIPAEEATLGLVDRIFTRVGASDNIALGQSTFLVEMIETSRILHQATSRALVLLDEIGRGTSTYDGLSLAWAVAEELRRDPKRRPMVIFATHFHELTRLARQEKGFINLNVLVREWNDEVIFMRKVAEGAADRSYGIHVARLAGIPGPVLKRAEEILRNLEARGPRPVPDGGFLQPQLPLFSDHEVGELMWDEGGGEGSGRAGDPASVLNEEKMRPIIDEIRSIDLDGMSPREAWECLEDWRARIKASLDGSDEGS
ncbi:MAG: DNA mismatch repair protein MutS [Candidatus Eisenbacteria bacterium]|uniref:DNA mismatch repair protein MutS n=1 Tax=Eiseniibacteriota bacterium TaxID=2212470 RepID=A0A948RY49_UNCEI|nr:DNA mismatch repair protein MutS [Candidatus Eisenbacteria bacterium]MBU1947153.1 DNA mismatch repair protein MutS [Candidatus Eisenbacteria bacterium]MBU2691227.1 DNA mismatch repair protein MutS [Candidatus Eisenbacteria bacterium]